MAYTAAAINATLFGKLNHNFLRDLALIASINRIPLVLEVHPSFPAKTVAELIAYAKANPDKVTMGVAGIGSGPHMAGELLKMTVGVNMISVPYRGSGPMLTDLLLGGQVQIAFDGLSSSIEHIRSGRLRALAVATPSRVEALPDIPTVGDAVPGFEASGWCGICAPTKTPVEIIEMLNKEINTGLAGPTMRGRLVGLGTIPFMTSSYAFGRFMAQETEKWGKVIRAAYTKSNLQWRDVMRRSPRLR
jgi:tripartite-type tricarboxylate transporter receptor subunit TctC